METDSVPSERLMWPILPFPQLKVDPDEENGSEVFSWREDGKVVDYLEDNGDESSRDDEFFESAPIGRIKDEKGQKNYNDKSPVKSECIEHKELDIKEEEDDDIILKTEKSYDSQYPSILLKVCTTSDEVDKKKQIKESPKSKNQSMLHECPKCSYNTIYKGRFVRHLIKHKKPEEINWYKCQECPYRSSQKYNLKTHVQIHNSNKLIIKCSKCSYETWTPTYLKRHQIRQHQGENGKGGHKCLECSYKTQYNYLLQKHALSHKPKEKLKNESQNPGSRLKLHQCPECSYSTIYKCYLKRHLIKHKKPDEILWYNCQECSYRCSRKTSLKAHAEIHNSMELILKCSKCSYETWRPSKLKIHEIRHQEHDENRWHICLECSYKSLDQSNLKKHLISHKSPDEIQWFECFQCSFKTAYKYSLKHHQLKHKAADEVEWFCCYKCSYKAKRKANLANHMLKHKK